MKIIPLSQGYSAFVDDADYELLRQYKWHVFIRSHSKTKYAATIFYEPTKRSVLMHRLILTVPIGKEVDHINGDGLDNRRCNLRLTDRAGNCQNRQKRGDGYKGVKDNKYGRWEARIQFNKRSLHLGTFDTAQQAAEAYNDAAVQYHGEFARLNVI